MSGETGNRPRHSALERADAVALGSALVAHHARRLGVRVLLLKGPGAAALGLRGPKASADVDALVEPGGLERLRPAFEVSGWVERFASAAPSIVEAHSVTLYKSDWPIDLDLHAYWPGFLLDRQLVFELLWKQRTAMPFAEVEAQLPGIEDSALVLALHTLRRQRAATRSSALDDLVARSRVVIGDDAGHLVASRARQLGATETARPFLEALGAHPAKDPRFAEPLQKWKLNSRATGHTDGWLLAIADARTVDKPRLIWKALFPDEHEMRGLHPELPPTRRGLAVGRFRRLLHGLRQSWPALRSIATARRSSKHRHLG